MISIILPVYNNEKYLRKCINSILNQSFNNFEVLAIDDGSTDKSYDILNYYSMQDKRIRVFQQAHLGVCSARNTGLFFSKGEYIVFVDSDDYLDQCYLNNLYTIISKGKYCLGCCAYYFEEYGNLDIRNISSKNSVINYHQALGFISGNECYGGYLWNKIFIKSFIDKNQIRFDENISLCEDMLFCCQYLNKAKLDTYYISDPAYHYVQHDGSTIDRYKKNSFYKELPAIRKIFDISKSYPNTAFYYNTVKRYINDCFMTAFSRSQSSHEDYMKKEIEVIKPYKKYLKHRNAVKYFLYFIFPFRVWIFLTERF